MRIFLCLMTVFCLFAIGIPSVSALPASGYSVEKTIPSMPVDQSDQDEAGILSIETSAEFIVPLSRSALIRLPPSRLVPQPAEIVPSRSITPPNPPPIA